MKGKVLRHLWYSLSARQRFLARRIYFAPFDFFDTITGNRHKYVPLRGAIYTGGPYKVKNFLNQSNHQLSLLKEAVNLQADDSVLDIGSGIGRTAIALANYLNDKGKYEGFDVVESGVDWCNSKIAKDFPNFNFTYVPLFNDLYNNSKLKADNFEFPFDNKSFDKVFSFSVFTHMQIGEIQNYFKEINRVLNDNGLAFSTFFLYDDESEHKIANQKGFDFSVSRDGYRLMNDKVKSGNIAIHKSKLQEMLERENLQIIEVKDGFWKGESKSSEYQDIVVFKKM